jgi:hypothetical protein
MYIPFQTKATHVCWNKSVVWTVIVFLLSGSVMVSPIAATKATNKTVVGLYVASKITCEIRHAYFSYLLIFFIVGNATHPERTCTFSSLKHFKRVLL